MKRVVQAVQLLALLCVAVFVVALFANEPEPIDRSATPTSTDASGEVVEPVVDGADLFGRCASCHGSTGGGGTGPRLSGGAVVTKFPDIEDQIQVVTDGRGGMPSFGNKLTPEEIRAVVEYTRTL